MVAKKKILVLATTFPGEVGDGTPSFVLDVCRGLASEFELLVVTPKIPRAPREGLIDGVKVWRFGGNWPFSSLLADGSILDSLKKNSLLMLQVPFFLLAFLFASRQAVKEFQPDVVHAHWVIPGGVISRFVFAGPRVITSHGGDLYSLRGAVGRWWKRWALAGAHVTVVNTEMVEIARSLGASGEASVIPGGPVSVVPRSEPKVPGQVLFVGRLAEKKGAEFLIRAVDGLPCQLHIVGAGPLMSELRCLATDNVVFHGGRGKEFVMSMIAASEVMVIPSVVALNGDQDGMPLTLMESTVSNVAVIASDLPGMKEVITDRVSGRLVPQRDVGALRAALQELLADPDLRDSFARELAKQSERFSVPTVVGKYRDVLLGAIDDHMIE